MSAAPSTLMGAARAVLRATLPAAKIAAAQEARRLWEADAPTGDLAAPPPPLRPQRPPEPALVPPGAVPRRRLGSAAGRAALLHAIAHIEFNAVDLAFDMACRFASEVDRIGLDPRAFVRDWIRVGHDEARHFGMLEGRLAELGRRYGDFPAHNGLWEAAERTADNLLARLVVAPLILEARGLDVTPGMIRRLCAAKDHASAALLEIIYRDEIGHVACGNDWFFAICDRSGCEPVSAFHELRARYFAGALKAPFNRAARDAAGLARSLYERF